MWANTVKRFYDMNHPLYTDESLKGFVITKMITAEDYKLITGFKYQAPTT